MTRMTLPARLIGAALFYICFSIATAQEPPVQESPPPAEEAVATPPAESTAETPVPVEAAPATPAATPGAKRIVMLPVEFTVYQKSVAGIEAVPDWTETAKFSLGDAAAQKLRQDNRFQLMDVPQFEGETASLLREHVEFFKIVADTALTFAQFGGKAWAEKKANFDYTLGDGLGFLADASGADYAFILAGSQVTQTGGAVFMQFLAAAGGYAAAGGGTFVAAGIVDLHTGDVKWLNSRAGAQVFGMTGSDVRNPATAAEVVARMFEGFPSHKFIQFPPF